VTAQAVLHIFELAQSGRDNTSISTMMEIPVSYIAPILNAHSDWVAVTKDGFAAMGKQYPEKFVRPKPEKSAAQKAGE
jgi:hypothetical protein